MEFVKNVTSTRRYGFVAHWMKCSTSSHSVKQTTTLNTAKSGYSEQSATISITIVKFRRILCK